MPLRKRGMVRCNDHQFIVIEEKDDEDQTGFIFEITTKQCMICGKTITRRKFKGYSPKYYQTQKFKSNKGVNKNGKNS